MTRINTNVSSLTAQKTLARSNTQLQNALTRLSTGLRINSGRDDPAGMIASESLGSDIISAQKAISNSQRASQMIATADSALGQVSSLLNDIRGLVTEAANSGAMSADQIAANQLQVDSSLDAVNRISQVTSFQGRRLLDGGLDFVTEDLAGMSTVSDLNIDSANLGAAGEVTVDVAITKAATVGKITDTSASHKVATASAEISLGTGFQFVADDTSTKIDFVVTDATKTNVAVEVQMADDTTAAAWGTGSGGEDLLLITLDSKNASKMADVLSAVNALDDVYAWNSGTTDGFDTDETMGQAAMNTSKVTIDAKNASAQLSNTAIVFKTGTTGGAPTGAYDADSNTLTITVDPTAPVVTEALLDAAVGGAQFTDDGVDPSGGFTSTIDDGAAGRQTLYGLSASGDLDLTGDTGATGGGAILKALTLQITGGKGSQVLSFQAGTTLAQMASAIANISDSTGVTATSSADTSAGTLTLTSTEYGSAGLVAVDVIDEGSGGAFESALSADRNTGTDIQATVNGFLAEGRGNTLSINTSTLGMSMTVDDGSTTDVRFKITEGGAMFQLGPDVVSNQQARLGLQSLNTAKLRGKTGRLYELGSGGDAALATDPTKAGAIVDEVITKVTSLRGRLGAFQKTTIDSNVNSLTETVENLTAAQSSIRDADFAAESANLTRAQILVQSGTSVLAIANQGPQNVLALLRNL